MTRDRSTEVDAIRFGVGTVCTLGIWVLSRARNHFLAAFAIAFVFSVAIGIAFPNSYVDLGSGGAWSLAGRAACHAIVDSLFSAFLIGIALSTIEDGVPNWRLARARALAVFPFVLPISVIYAALAHFGLPIIPGSAGWLAVAALSLAIEIFTWMYVPVLVREGGGPVRALARNFALAQGRRWPILGLMLMLMGAAAMLGILIGIASQSLLAVLADMDAGLVSALALDSLSTLAVNTLYYVAAAVIYRLLSREKDGLREEVAAVFD